MVPRPPSCSPRHKFHTVTSIRHTTHGTVVSKYWYSSLFTSVKESIFAVGCWVALERRCVVRPRSWPLRVKFCMRSIPLLCFCSLTLLHRHLSRQGAGYKEVADRTDLFVGRSMGAGQRTTEALASKRAFMNERGSMDGIHRARWDTLNAWYVSHPFIRCSVGQLI